ncbi:hypothetical protein CXG81DRAFT_17662 [Caulochytrium protostelioides]|uniref:Store-operated calcium entry-associated regulatory factor n=1 Tax=Caulochytrium protostelioides TaxID=1555241 RepID=A0A4P9XBE1_9FUNG|nr:hypothetical protein CXG81DRAFT_17662 [Caulochytrium protostelioides]|eukprot:RKP02692.1 hypothetical protein CXG81DRAFT_17662 [Caulochytrium protostelioides]
MHWSLANWLTVPAAVQLLMGPRPVPLAELETLTFVQGRLTESRRNASVPQLKCMGGDAARYAPDIVVTVHCVNRLRQPRHRRSDPVSVGADATNATEPMTGTAIPWDCTSTELPRSLRMANMAIECEGWADADDPRILPGSCALGYTLHKTSRPAAKATAAPPVQPAPEKQSGDSALDSSALKPGELPDQGRAWAVPRLHPVDSAKHLWDAIRHPEGPPHGPSHPPHDPVHPGGHPPKSGQGDAIPPHVHPRHGQDGPGSHTLLHHLRALFVPALVCFSGLYALYRLALKRATQRDQRLAARKKLDDDEKLATGPAGRGPTPPASPPRHPPGASALLRQVRDTAGARWNQWTPAFLHVATPPAYAPVTQRRDGPPMVSTRVPSVAQPLFVGDDMRAARPMMHRSASTSSGTSEGTSLGTSEGTSDSNGSFDAEVDGVEDVDDSGNGSDLDEPGRHAEYEIYR